MRAVDLSILVIASPQPGKFVKYGTRIPVATSPHPLVFFANYNAHSGYGKCLTVFCPVGRGKSCPNPAFRLFFNLNAVNLDLFWFAIGAIDGDFFCWQI